MKDVGVLVERECSLCMSLLQAAMLGLSTQVLQIIAKYNVFHCRLKVKSCKLGQEPQLSWRVLKKYVKMCMPIVM